MKTVVNNANQILNLILKLANMNEEKYDLKEYNTSELGSYETVAGDRESVMLHGSVWIITLKEVLESIDIWYKNFFYSIEPENFRYGITSIIHQGNPVVMMTDYVYEWCVYPENRDIKNANIETISTTKSVNDICCYTYDDELGRAVEKIKHYLEVYGPNLKEIPMDIIINRINELEENKEEIFTKKK